MLGFIKQRTEKGWREVLVDIDPEVPDQLRFVLSPSTTPATENFIQVRLCVPELVLISLLTLSSTHMYCCSATLTALGGELSLCK